MAPAKPKCMHSSNGASNRHQVALPAQHWARELRKLGHEARPRTPRRLEPLLKPRYEPSPTLHRRGQHQKLLIQNNARAGVDRIFARTSAGKWSNVVHRLARAFEGKRARFAPKIWFSPRLPKERCRTSARCWESLARPHWRSPRISKRVASTRGSRSQWGAQRILLE